jgi:hypothetical protein
MIDELYIAAERKRLLDQLPGYDCCHAQLGRNNWHPDTICIDVWPNGQLYGGDDDMQYDGKVDLDMISSTQGAAAAVAWHFAKAAEQFKAQLAKKAAV